MKIGLVDVDSHNFPNLCLMKLSEYHTRRGDQVEWWSPKGRYDLVYKSRVFTDTYSKDTIVVNNADQVIQGGTGYGPGGKNLPYEIEHIRPDYFLYPRFLGTAYGFLSRGCPRNCGFCIVSGKEGRRSAKVADLSEFWRGEDEIKLLDPNLLACPDHEALLEQLAASRALVDFTQGLDIRLTNPDNIALLNRVRTKAVHFAWDNPEEDLTEHFRRFVAHTAIRSDRNRRVYVLTNYGSTHEQDLYRVNTLRVLGYDPYVMIYERPTAPKITRHLQRWVNNKRIFHTVKDFKDYAPMKKEVHRLAYVTIPKDLSKVQSKVLFGLTKRQVICFGAAAVIGVPLFFLSRGALGTTTAALCMILVMLPFFLFAMYQRNGQPLEVFLGHLIQNKFLRPKVRIYQTNNLYSALVRQYELEQEVRKIAGKNGKTRKNGKAQA